MAPPVRVRNLNSEKGGKNHLGDLVYVEFELLYGVAAVDAFELLLFGNCLRVYIVVDE